jgi:hypothetical protein
MRLWSKYMIKEMEIQQMTLPVNPAGRPPVAEGYSLQSEKKKDGLPVGQIATSLGVGGAIGILSHLYDRNAKSLYQKLKAHTFQNQMAQKILLTKGEAKVLKTILVWTRTEKELLDNKVLENECPPKFFEHAKNYLSKMDLDNTAKHIGKNIGFAALAAGATALGYGVMRALFQPKKESPPTPTPPPTA